ncbi:hypothetical protein CSUI_001386 [Cystoisospora suis]|uniref:Uncharacterized protein n=1 Tax=Cystoisospora suis TaxID=483139 RepID=A0A2C6LCL2_9APIC|nr:hypothetical protein CSUI_001386 [Cystoisospora suis]
MTIFSALSLTVVPLVRHVRTRGEGLTRSVSQRSFSTDPSSSCIERVRVPPVGQMASSVSPQAESGLTSTPNPIPESPAQVEHSSSHTNTHIQSPRSSSSKPPLPCPSLRVPYRDFLRACAKTFGEDFQARYYVTKQMTHLLRENPFNFPPSRLAKELKDAADFVRFKIIQAQLNPATGAYRATPTDDHIRKGDVIELNCYDPERMKTLPWLSKKPGESPPPETLAETPSKPSASEAKF